MVGKTDRANHLYDLSWFWTAARAGHLPAVSLLKAPAYQNGHPGNSDPLDEQVFLVTVLNFLQQLPEWRHMAVIIAWDEAPSMRPAVLEAGGIADITGRSFARGGHDVAFIARGAHLGALQGGAKLGVPTPIHQTIAACLTVHQPSASAEPHTPRTRQCRF
jgi:Phosphoesterase family